MLMPWILIEIAFGKLVLNYNLEAPQSELLVDIRRSDLTPCKAWYARCIVDFIRLLLISHSLASDRKVPEISNGNIGNRGLFRQSDPIRVVDSVSLPAV